MRLKVLMGMDYPCRFNQVQLRLGEHALRKWLKLGTPNHAAGSPRIVVIDRASSETFYQSSGSETHMSGADRRTIPNIRELTSLLDESSNAQVVDLARIAPRQQVRLVQDADVLVGQHGAGLAHMLWMKSGASVVEIAPPLPPEVKDLFSRMATSLGHKYIQIPQDHVKAPINVELLARQLLESR